MTATEMPRYMVCGSCGESMHIQLTAQTCSCTNTACAEHGKTFVLPVREHELAEKLAE